MRDDDPKPRVTGRCNCGAIRYFVTGPLRDVVACHCTECRRFTGSLWNATAARRDDCVLRENGELRWYQSSLHARRGFCGHCASSLFLDYARADYMVITAGTLDAPTGIRFRQHIFLDEAGDYYDVVDELPKHPQFGPRLTIPEA